MTKSSSEVPVITNGPVKFNAVGLHGAELEYLQQAVRSGHISGNGEFTKRCQAMLEKRIGTQRALLTHSATAALEMAIILAKIEPGDEVILPSYTFVSSANAVVLRGGVPVFADVRPDTLNIDESKLEELLTPRTKAVMVVHYAGVGCAMESINSFAKRHDLLVIEDAAQALGASYCDVPLGTFGDMSCFSFHETKNVVAGEGGALCVNNRSLAGRAEIIWEKGTDRARFNRGEVDKYTWQDVGSSFLPSELIAAFLLAQLEHSEGVTERRRAIWNTYHDLVAPLEAGERLLRPSIPAECSHNGHIYWVLLRKDADRQALLDRLRSQGVHCASHYVPLHSSPAGQRFGKAPQPLPITDDAAGRLVRLPMHAGLQDADVERVVDVLRAALD